jgi:hypothetical protein
LIPTLIRIRLRFKSNLHHGRAGVGALVLALAIQGVGAASDLPDARLLVAGLAERQRQFEAALADYTYDLEMVYEQLDKQGLATSRKSRQYEVFFVKGKRVRRLVAEDGTPLTPDQQAKVDADMRRYVDEVLQGKARPPRYNDLELSAVLDRYEFRSVARESIDGRPSVLMEFAPLPGKRDLKVDPILRRLAGRVWIDEAEGAVARAEIHATESIKVAFGLGAKVAVAEVTSEFVKVADGVWLPRRTQSRVQGRILLVKGIHERTTATFSHYRKAKEGAGHPEGLHRW